MRARSFPGLTAAQDDTSITKPILVNNLPCLSIHFRCKNRPAFTCRKRASSILPTKGCRPLDGEKPTSRIDGENFMMVRKLVRVAVQLVLLTTFALAQGVATGDLHVMVKDPKGDLVTNATVTARDESKALERSTSDNAEGRYRILLLPPGTYAVTVEAPGFAKATVKNVAIAVGTMSEIPITLSVAGTAEVIDVSSAAELVETQRTSSTDTINQRKIDNLPINGRNYINFALTDSQVLRDNAPSIGAAPSARMPSDRLDLAAVHAERRAGHPAGAGRDKECHQFRNFLRLAVAGNPRVSRKFLRGFGHGHAVN